MNDTIIGVDLAKRVFQVHGACKFGQVSTVVFEACGSASYWARQMEELGHEKIGHSLRKTA